ncbi:hypothetical protein [Phaeobacter sp. 11ANDIMAR09]|uniref:hypothetical protein n=1 Tax=Phaeobacter sp. 11ANDIMAR09 TaxID=1225647 RepID=UPI0006C8DC91|nr:hypothetical protein [Phaeobacter sp. 11ANDIMAR09]KPD10342.1 hypothetical protein AN476_21450 [Phaeobacter sp. 11ANDIMAR09]
MIEQVVIVTSAGVARLQDEAVRIAEIKARGCVPVECGPEIPMAPGRGPMVRFTPREMRQTDGGGYVSIRTGDRGRDAARVADAFDAMERAAVKAHQAAEGRREKAGQDPRNYEPLFTPGQISAARDYAALVERVTASGVKCSSLEAVHSGAVGGGDREAAIFRDFQRLRALHRRIGDGLAKEVRRIRPSVNGGLKRRAIYVRKLVDMVCLGDMSILQVLHAHGWSKDGGASKALRLSLCSALDRMQGYDLAEMKKGVDT